MLTLNHTFDCERRISGDCAKVGEHLHSVGASLFRVDALQCQGVVVTLLLIDNVIRRFQLCITLVPGENHDIKCDLPAKQLIYD